MAIYVPPDHPSYAGGDDSAAQNGWISLRGVMGSLNIAFGHRVSSTTCCRRQMQAPSPQPMPLSASQG
eukprot:scaffold137753_cov21-Prasinocladus_malaysianus.AAC.1